MDLKKGEEWLAWESGGERWWYQIIYEPFVRGIMGKVSKIEAASYKEVPVMAMTTWVPLHKVTPPLYLILVGGG